MAYKVEIDREGCIACATCYTIDSVHFQGDSEGKSKVVGGTDNGGQFRRLEYRRSTGSRRLLPGQPHKSDSGLAPSFRQ